MSDHSNYYVILGLSTNNVIESLTMEGYNRNDICYYLMNNVNQFETSHPFIFILINQLLDMYKKQYKMDINLTNFQNLIENSEEFGNNFLKIIECQSDKIINACSYYQNNKKTITLKPIVHPQTITLQNLIPPPNIISPKIIIQPKVQIGLKKKN